MSRCCPWIPGSFHQLSLLRPLCLWWSDARYPGLKQQFWRLVSREFCQLSACSLMSVVWWHDCPSSFTSLHCKVDSSDFNCCSWLSLDLGWKISLTVLFNHIGHRYICLSVHSTLAVLKFWKSSMISFLQNCLLIFFLAFLFRIWSVLVIYINRNRLFSWNQARTWQATMDLLMMCHIFSHFPFCPLLSVHCPSCSSSLSNLDPSDLLEPHVRPCVVGYIPGST